MTEMEQEYSQPSEDQCTEEQTLQQRLNTLLNTSAVLAAIAALMSPYVPIEVVQRNVADLYKYGFFIAVGSAGLSRIINTPTIAQILFSQEFNDSK